MSLYSGTRVRKTSGKGLNSTVVSFQVWAPGVSTIAPLLHCFTFIPDTCNRQNKTHAAQDTTHCKLSHAEFFN